MNKCAYFTILLAAGSALVSFAARTDPAPAVPDAFMQQLVAGINARDLKALNSIVHPATLKCMTAENQAYYAWALWKDGSKRYTIPKDYRIEMRTPLDIKALKSTPPSANAPLDWPVAPDAAFYIDYRPAPLSFMRKLVEITLHDGKALLVMECPTAPGLKAFEEQHKVILARQERLSRLWRSMNETDRQAFILMAKQGMKLDVMKGAEQKYHLNTDESLAFMDMVEYADTP